MESTSGVLLIDFLASAKYLVASLDPASLDIIKIFAGSIGWIGALTLFMWAKEKRVNGSLIS